MHLRTKQQAVSIDRYVDTLISKNLAAISLAELAMALNFVPRPLVTSPNLRHDFMLRSR